MFHEQKSARNRFHEQNQFAESSMIKISSRIKENQCTIFTEKNQQATGFTNKNQHETESTKKNQHLTSFTNKKSACNKFHEQNMFHRELNYCTSFTKRKTNMKHVSPAKISAQQVPRKKNINIQQVL